MFLLLVAATAQAKEVFEEPDLAQAYGDKSFVSIAAGISQPIARAPSVATVITAQDIAAIGAADLDEVLETVPGLHVARSPLGYNPIYTIRGIYSQYNPQVLMLINGIPITGVIFGDRSIVWGGMPLENVVRIEVIRGPGSALYGADAFSGVINIITKTAADIKGSQFGARAGSFNSRDAWLQHGGNWKGYDIAAYLRVGSTDGQRRTIQEDAQSGLDTLMVTSASRSPGPLNLGRDAIDGRLDIARDQWRLRAGYQQRDKVGTGAGVASALDPVGKNYGERISSDLTYQNADLAPDLEVTAQASYLSITEKSDLTLYPPGFAGAFPNGMIGNPDKWERHLRFNTSAAYNGIQHHRLRIGAGTQHDDLYRTEESNNFSTGGPVVAATPFLLPHDRRVSHVYAQDEWNFIQDWYLTAGVRHDRYTDFGGTTNPRLALVWDTAYNLTSKLLYGRAFRSPSFSELYNSHANPVLRGNPNLKPETNESLELAFAWQPDTNVQTNLNLFRYQMRDILRPDTSAVVQNAGRQKGYGMEAELIWDTSHDLRLSGNYAQQHSTNEEMGQDAGNAPRQQLYARADWRFISGWTLNTQLNYVADRKREPGDTRPAVADYHTVDITLRNQQRNTDWELAFSVRNLFGADAREPSPNGTPFVPIPYDLPLAPREYRFELSRTF